MSWVDIVTPAVTFLGGATGKSIFDHFAGKDRTDSENNRDDSVAAQAISTATTLLLQPLNDRIDTLAKDLENQKAEREAERQEREADRKENARIRNLFSQAIEVIAGFLDVAKERGFPGPTLSPELLAEVHKTS